VLPTALASLAAERELGLLGADLLDAQVRMFFVMLLHVLAGGLPRRVQRRRGHVRDGLSADDIPILLAQVIDIAGGVSPQLWRRYLGIVLDGLRGRRDGPTPLVVPALAHDQLDLCMQTWRPHGE
jgi:hypothetical protein